MKIIKAIFTIIFFASISLGVIYFFMRGEIEKANRPIKIISPDNYTQSVKNQISKDDVVQITGTPNLLNQVSQESLVQDTNGTQREVVYYYAGLQEYGYDFAVRVLPGRLNAQKQTFTGRVVGINDTEFDTRIKNSLNRPINFEDSVNADAATEIDKESQKQLSQKSEADFKNSALLILDQEIIQPSDVYLKLSFWVLLITVFLTTLFRKSVFSME